MTINRDKKYDIKRTNHLLSKKEVVRKEPSWLDHKKKCCTIDYELLKGATKEQLAQRSGRKLSGVNVHIQHLKKEHGLTISQIPSSSNQMDAAIKKPN